MKSTITLGILFELGNPMSLSLHITCIPWVGDFEHTIYAILLAHVIHLLLLSDYTYFYIKALVSQSGTARVLPMSSFSV